MNYLLFERFFQVFLVFFPITMTFADSFNYDNPEEWGLDYPTCNGKRQSPIDISKGFRPYLLPLINFGFYNESFEESIDMYNSGSTIVLNITATAEGQPYIAGGPLKGRYEVQSVHFHWGKKVGSEHTLFGQYFDLEMHVVHRNNRDGDLAVLGVLFKEGQPKNPALDKVFNELEDVIEYESLTIVENLTTLGSLLGNLNTKFYYSYHGSLTTPPCIENVTWIVFHDTLGLDDTVIPKFLEIKDHRNQKLKSNVRPLQKQNNRDIKIPIWKIWNN